MQAVAARADNRVVAHNTPSVAGAPPDAGRMARLAGGAAGLLRLLRGLRQARDEGTITDAQYEAAVSAITPEQDAAEGEDS